MAAKNMKKKFGPKNKAEEPIFAEESLRVYSQQLIQQMLNDTKTSKKKFAELVGAKLAKDVFTSEYDLRIREFAKIAHVLGYTIILNKMTKKEVAERKKLIEEHWQLG